MGLSTNSPGEQMALELLGRLDTLGFRMVRKTSTPVPPVQRQPARGRGMDPNRPKTTGLHPDDEHWKFNYDCIHCGRKVFRLLPRGEWVHAASRQSDCDGLTFTAKAAGPC